MQVAKDGWEKEETNIVFRPKLALDISHFPQAQYLLLQTA